MAQDNKPLKDGQGNQFTARMRDISAAGDGTIQRPMTYTTLFPVDYGTGGCYHHCAISGAMTAGLAANAPIYSFWYPATMVCLVRKITFQAWSTSVAFSGGMFGADLFAARNFTAPASGGLTPDLTGNNAKLLTAMAPALAQIRIANTGALTPGTRVLDAAPIERANVTVPQTALSQIVRQALLNKAQGEHPLILRLNEGFVIQGNVPTVGTWQFAVTTEWDEVPNF